MPLYSFKNERTGETEERFYHMADAPAIGAYISDGLVRVPDSFQSKVVADRHFVSQQMPRNYKHHADAGGSFNELGQPVFDSMKQVQETAARSRGEEKIDSGYDYD